MTGLLSILHLEDDFRDAELVEASLEEGGLNCVMHIAASGDEFSRMIRSREYDLILSDSSIHELSGMDALEMATTIAPTTTFIFVSGTTMDEGREDRKSMASDYVPKDRLGRLPTAVRRAVNEARGKQCIATLSATSELQAEVLSNLSESILVIDQIGRIRIWNEAASVLFECGSKSPKGLDLSEADALCGCHYFQTTLHGELQTGESRELFWEFDSRPGKWILTKHSKSIESSALGHLDLYIAVDVSARKLLEARSDELESRFEQCVADRTSDLSSQNAELRSFSYSVSHDLQAPLLVILGYSQSLAEDFGEALGVEGAGYLNRIKSAGVRMTQLITGLLHLAVLDRTQLTCTRVDLTALAEDIAWNLIAASGSASLRVIVQPGLTVVADGRLMRSLLENLIGNAIKFAPKERQTSIEIGQCDRNGIPSYFVRDGGDGFSSENAELIFEPFKRVDVRDSVWGHGVGLATARRIVEKHGGQISAESRPGEGATFYFSIPPSELSLCSG